MKIRSIRPSTKLFSLEFLIIFFISLPCYSAILANLGFLIGIAIGKFHLIAAFALATVSAKLLTRENFKVSSGSLLVSIVVLVISVSLSITLVSTSRDGKAFHDPAVVLLMDGWNPLEDKFPAKFAEESRENLSFNHGHVETDVKGQYYAGAVSSVFFNRLHAANYTHLILILASVLVTYLALTSLAVKRSYSIIGSLALGLNPIAVLQIYVSMVDGVFASTLLIIIAALIGFIYSHKRVFVYVIIFSLPLCFNIKMSGPIYCGVIVASILAGALLARRISLKQVMVLSGCFLLAGVIAAIIGINPYFHNYQKHGNPLPILTAKQSKFSHMPAVITTGLAGEDRAISLWRSQLSLDISSHWNIPRYDYSHYVPWQTVNAFGGMFIVIVLMSLLIAPQLSHKKFIYTILLGLIASVLINPAPAIGRYIPQLWIIPGIIAAAYLRNNKTQKPLFEAMSLMIMAIMILHASLVFFQATSFAFKQTHKKISKGLYNSMGYSLYTRNDERKSLRRMLEERFNTKIEIVKDESRNSIYNYRVSVGAPKINPSFNKKMLSVLPLNQILGLTHKSHLLMFAFGDVQPWFSQTRLSEQLGHLGSRVNNSEELGAFIASLPKRNNPEGKGYQEWLGEDGITSLHTSIEGLKISVKSDLVHSRFIVKYADLKINNKYIPVAPGLNVLVVQNGIHEICVLNYNTPRKPNVRCHAIHPTFFDLMQLAWRGKKFEE